LLCGNVALLKTNTQKGYQAPELYSIYHCPACNTAFSLPRPDTGNLYQLIYEKGNIMPSYDRYWKYYNEIENQNNPLDYLANSEIAYWALVRVLKKTLNVSKDANILELGSGLGYTTYALRKDGYVNAFGLDIAKEAVDKAIAKFGQFYICADAAKYAQTSSTKYDVIFMTELIEHVENPKQLLENLIPLLKNGGSFVMTTPDKSIYNDDVAWATDRPPVHCWWFSDKSFYYLADYLHMNATFVDFSEYYSNHQRLLINVRLYEALCNTHIFDTSNQLIASEHVSGLKSFRILPGWIKKTSLYKTLSWLIYPLLSDSMKRISKKKSATLCVLLTLRK
jgi:2-polyprenyl-3-methyl-5-hydroxy-6-metoxy-1,4-benzoquinol methylase